MYGERSKLRTRGGRCYAKLPGNYRLAHEHHEITGQDHQENYKAKPSPSIRCLNHKTISTEK